MQRTHLSFKDQLKVTFYVIFLITFIEAANIFLGRMLSLYGLYPNNTERWYGVLTAPFLHGSVNHYLSNIVPLGIFSFLLLQHGIQRYIFATLFIICVGGGLVWLFGRPSIHVGASGVIYGYFGFLVVAGVVSREFKLILISILVTFLWGGMVWGVLPAEKGISFESHLFGMLAGVGAGLLWGDAPPSKHSPKTETA